MSVVNIPQGVVQIDVDEVMVPRVKQPLFKQSAQGSYVAVRKASEDITRLGLYLGDMPIGVAPVVKNGELLTLQRTYSNPCMFVFETGELVYGFESWWSTIETPDDLKQITNQDIENVWYVRVLKAVS
jgi:hypothetical protein